MLGKLFVWIKGLWHPAAEPLIFESSAWNNFGMSSRPEDYPLGSIRRAASIANRYMGGANNGGLNAFLTNNWELDASEVLNSLKTIGADEAAKQFELVLKGLGVPVPASTQDERWELLEQHWTEELNDHDILSDEADRSLTAALERHVAENEAFYLENG